MANYVEIFIGIVIISLSVLIYKWNYSAQDKSIAPKHYNRNVGQETFVVSDLISPEIGKDLMDIVFDIGQAGGFKHFIVFCHSYIFFSAYYNIRILI
jgi:hypothetical protein